MLSEICETPAALAKTLKEKGNHKTWRVPEIAQIDLSYWSSRQL